MTGPKTNERPGTRAVARNVRMSARKARVVLDLVRGVPVDEARAILAYTERAAAEVVGKCLESAVANAEHNDEVDPEVLHISACFADEGRTLYRWRPRARGRATRIRKRTCHITVIVSPMPADMLAIEQAKREAVPGSRAARRRGQEAARRSERVAASREADTDTDEATDADVVDTTAEATEIAQEAIEAAEAAEAATAPDGTDEATADVDAVEETDATQRAEEAGVVDTTVEATTQDATDADDSDDSPESPDSPDDDEGSAS